MSDEQLQKEEPSMIFGVSLRAWLALIIVATVCLIECFIAYSQYKGGESVTIDEPLYSLSVMALSFYFGQKTQGKS